MDCLNHCTVVSLIFICTCQFVSACHSSASGKETLGQSLSAEPVMLQSTEKKAATAPITPVPVWHGIVQDVDPLAAAADIYSKSPSNPAGISEYQGLVFCIIELPQDDVVTDDLLYEMDAMLQEKEMLRKRYNLPADFNLQRRVLENRMNFNSDCYRYATVYRLKDIQALRK